MACVTTHAGGKVQGAGLCCSMVQSGQLGKTIGSTVMVTDAGGHCGTCNVVASKSKKHLGRPVLRYKRGGPGCPTGGTGCCAMTA
jgi:hypothetical protein